MDAELARLWEFPASRWCEHIATTSSPSCVAVQRSWDRGRRPVRIGRRLATHGRRSTPLTRRARSNASWSVPITAGNDALWRRPGGQALDQPARVSPCPERSRAAAPARGSRSIRCGERDCSGFRSLSPFSCSVRIGYRLEPWPPPPRRERSSPLPWAIGAAPPTGMQQAHSSALRACQPFRIDSVGSEINAQRGVISSACEPD